MSGLPKLKMQKPVLILSKSNDIRPAKMIVFLGTNGTGKTTQLKKFVIEALKRKEKALIVTPHDQEWTQIELVHPDYPHHIQNYVGARRMIFEEKNTLENIEKYFSTGLLIFDDCRAYLDASTNKLIHKLLISRRQKMIDIFAVGHGFTEIPPKFFTFATELVLFKTLDNIYSRKNVLRNFEEMVELQEFVNKQAEKNPYFCKPIKMT